jgi:hypothetical protein
MSATTSGSSVLPADQRSNAARSCALPSVCSELCGRGVLEEEGMLAVERYDLKRNVCSGRCGSHDSSVSRGTRSGVSGGREREGLTDFVNDQADLAVRLAHELFDVLAAAANDVARIDDLQDNVCAVQHLLQRREVRVDQVGNLCILLLFFILDLRHAQRHGSLHHRGVDERHARGVLFLLHRLAPGLEPGLLSLPVQLPHAASDTLGQHTKRFSSACSASTWSLKGNELGIPMSFFLSSRERLFVPRVRRALTRLPGDIALCVLARLAIALLDLFLDLCPITGVLAVGGLCEGEWRGI